jgi:hypothetical protein
MCASVLPFRRQQRPAGRLVLGARTSSRCGKTQFSLAGPKSTPRDLGETGRGNSVHSILVMILPVVMVAPRVVIAIAVTRWAPIAVGVRVPPVMPPARDPMAAPGAADPANAFNVLCCIQGSGDRRIEAAHWRGRGGLASKANPAESDACDHNQFEILHLHVLLSILSRRQLNSECKKLPHRC